MRRAVLWKHWDGTGLEHGRWDETTDGHRLSGVAVLTVDAAPCRVDYEVDCDGDWRTRDVSVRMTRGVETVTRTLRRDAQNKWWVEDVEVEALAGAVDVDLGFSPSTNTLPVKRLGLAVGASAAIVTAWVRFPSLDVQRGPQRYSRLADRLYRYEGLDSGFTADVLFDAYDIVLSYPPGWIQL